MNSFLNARESVSKSAELKTAGTAMDEGINEVSELEQVSDLNQETQPVEVSTQADTSTWDEAIPKVELVSRDGIARTIRISFEDGRVLELECKY